MPLGPGFPGNTDVRIPTFGQDESSSGRLIVGFSRNVDDFALPRYVQYVPTDVTRGYYLKLTNQESGRVINAADYVWPDGQNRPQRNRDTESFIFKPFETFRYDYGFTIGQKTIDEAGWNIREQHAKIEASKCMTHRTIRVMDVLTTTANWGTAADPDLSVDHFAATATALGTGGSIFAGTSTDPRILKMFNLIAVIVTKDTMGVVKGTPSELCAVFNPVTARKIAESAEIHDYIKGSPDAKAMIEKNLVPQARYGLPETLYGYRIHCEESVKVTGRVGSSLARSFVVPDNAVILMSRVGGLIGEYGAPSFSTMTMFMREEMTVETFTDPKNRLVEGHVTDDTDEVLTCPASGYYVVDAGS